jgi:hypothetical protein
MRHASARSPLHHVSAAGSVPPRRHADLCHRPLAAHCHLGLGTLSAKIGRLEQARAELSTAIDLYRAMEMTFWLPQAEAALAEAEGR